jgi:uncharacterized membrane protein
VKSQPSQSPKPLPPTANENKMKKDNETSKEFIEDGNHWKFGLFYFNRADKRTIVPCRQKGFGQTLNFASTYALYLLIGTIILVLLMAFIPEFISGQ